MTDREILQIVKYKAGLTMDVRDTYILDIIRGARAELKNSGVHPEGQDENYTAEYEMYLVDYSYWLYSTRGEDVLPRHLRFRRNNLIVGHV